VKFSTSLTANNQLISRDTFMQCYTLLVNRRHKALPASQNQNRSQLIKLKGKPVSRISNKKSAFTIYVCHCCIVTSFCFAKKCFCLRMWFL